MSHHEYPRVTATPSSHAETIQMDKIGQAKTWSLLNPPQQLVQASDRRRMPILPDHLLDKRLQSAIQCQELDTEKVQQTPGRAARPSSASHIKPSRTPWRTAAPARSEGRS